MASNLFKVGVVLQAFSDKFVRGMKAGKKAAVDAFQAMRGESNKAESNLGGIERKAGRVSSAFSRLFAKIRRLGPTTNKSASEAAQGLNKLETKASAAGQAFNKMGVAFRALIGAQIGRLFLSVARGNERLEKSFVVVTGSIDEAREEMEFARETALRLGTDVTTTSQAYLNFTAAAKGTKVEGEAGRKVFTSIVAAMGKMGRSSEETQGALKALQDMLSKSTVSAEELKGQLGDRLPGAMNIAARAMGLTSKELQEMMARGEILAEDLLPKLSAELDKTFKPNDQVDSFDASWNRLVDSFKNGIATINESTNTLNAAGSALDVAGSVVNFVSIGFTTVVEKIKAASTALGLFYDYLAQDIEFTEFKEQASDAFEVAENNIAKAADRAFDLENKIAKAGRAATEAGDKTANASDKAAKATKAQSEAFSAMALRIGKANEKEFPELQRQLIRMAQNEGLTRDQTAALQASLDSMRKTVGQTSTEFTRLADAIGDAKNIVDLMKSLDGLSLALERNQITQGEYEKGLTKVSEKAGELNKKTEDSAELTKKEATEQRANTEAKQEATAAQAKINKGIGVGLALLRFMRDHIQQTTAGLRELSDESANLFTTWLEATRGQEEWSVSQIESFARARSEVGRLTAEIDTMDDLIRQAQGDLQFATSELSAWFKRVELQALQIERAFLQQKQGAESAIASLEDMTSASEQTVSQAQAMVDSYRLLDDQTLSKLQREVDRLTQANERLEESAERALRRYQDLVDQQAGNDVAIAQREQAQALADLEEQLQAAREAGNAKAIEDIERAIALARQYHAERMAQLSEERQELRESAIEQQEIIQAPVQPPQPDRSLPAPAQPQQAAQPGTLVPANTLLPAQVQPVRVDPEDLRRIIDVLPRPDIRLTLDGAEIARAIYPETEHLNRLRQ